MVEYVQLVRSIRHVAHAYWLDLIVGVLVLGAILEVAVRRDAASAPRTTLWLAIPALAILAVPVLARRHHPFGAAAGFWLLAAAFSFVDGRLVSFPVGIFLLGMAASFLLGNLRKARHAWIGLLITLGGAAIVVYNQPTHQASSFVFVPALFGISWLAGYALHTREEQAEAAEARAAQAEQERETAARIAVAEERARIARELHDVVAHAVSVMVLQVGAVRHKLPPGLEEDSEALRHVEATGRTALTEMRRLLTAMRPDGDQAELSPQPGLDMVDALAEEVERAGLPVHVHIEGERRPLARAVDLSAYRIVQEGLTNALKHARASRADVTLRYERNELRIEVRDDGVGSARSDGRGHGLVGIRERVKIYGGEMTAGAGQDGGFVLSARLPLGGEAS